jgi:hypothetical protein
MAPFIIARALAVLGSLTLLAAASPLTGRLQARAASVPIGCVLAKCGLDSIGCFFDTTCRKELDCVNACSSLDEDAAFVCQVRCFAAYNSPKFAKLSSCLQKNQCMPRGAVTACPAPTNAAVLASSGINMETMKGTWWVLKGLSPRFDLFTVS